MNRARLFGCLLGVSGLLLPARFALGDGGGLEPEGASPAPFVGVWSVSATPDSTALAAGRHAFNDLVLFEDNGFFMAEAFGPMGFGQMPFTVTELSEGVLGFTSTASNDSQGTLVWNGVLQNRRIVGSLVWTKPDGTSATYNFTANQADAEAGE